MIFFIIVIIKISMGIFIIAKLNCISLIQPLEYIIEILTNLLFSPSWGQVPNQLICALFCLNLINTIFLYQKYNITLVSNFTPLDSPPLHYAKSLNLKLFNLKPTNNLNFIITKNIKIILVSIPVILFVFLFSNLSNSLQ